MNKMTQRIKLKNSQPPLSRSKRSKTQTVYLRNRKKRSNNHLLLKSTKSQKCRIIPLRRIVMKRKEVVRRTTSRSL